MRITQATRKLRAAFFWAALMLMLAGTAGISSAQGTAATVKPATQATQAHQEQAQAYRYNPAGRIDPFRPFVDPEAAAKKKKVRPLSPLQRAGIEEFTLVGVIEGNKSRRAMVQDASGKFYSLVRGSYIGLNKGRVTAIHKDKLIVLERITMDGGKIESRRQVMKLRQDEVKP